MNYRRIKQKSLITTLLRQVHQRGWVGALRDALALGESSAPSLSIPLPLPETHREGGWVVGSALQEVLLYLPKVMSW